MSNIYPTSGIRQDLINTLTGYSVNYAKYLGGDYQNNLAEQLQLGYTLGESIPTLTQRVRAVTGAEKVGATRYARTMTNEVYNQAHMVRYQEAGIPGVEFSAANNEKTCEICAALDGTIFSSGRSEYHSASDPL